MFANQEPERPVVVTLVLLQALALVGASIFTAGKETATTVTLMALAAALMIASLLLYLGGVRRARLVSVVLIPVLGGLYLPEPFVTSYAPLALMVAPALSLVLANPAWVVGGAAIQMLLLLWRAGFTGVYAEPMTQVIYAMIIGSLVIARMVTDQARRRAEEQSRLLAQERAHLEDRVAERTRELASTNQELLRATHMRDLFLASVSHELRTPLNIILGGVELLREEVYGELSPRQHRSLATVAESGAHLLHLINDILDLAKMESGTFAIEVDVVDVPELCEQVVRLVTPDAERKGLTVELSVGEDVGKIPGDHRRLRQILLNLLSNAVKFTPAGSVGLEVSSFAGGRGVEFAVWDTGIGIAAEEQQRLFQPFTQLDSRLARQYEGTGLGLALVAQLALLHGGSVGVSSLQGVGSRFWVRLPAGAGRGEPAPRADEDVGREGAAPPHARQGA